MLIYMCSGHTMKDVVFSNAPVIKVKNIIKFLQ